MAANKQGPTTTTKQQQQLPAAAAAAGGDMDPKFDWIEHAGSYVLRLHLQGFKKDDFRVQVDGAGRLTVRGTAQAQHAAAHPRRSFHKMFQLPSAANLDGISGRFEAGVLTITVPKWPATTASAPAPAPATIEELIMKPPVKEAAAAAAAAPRDQVHGTTSTNAKQLPKDTGVDKREAKPKEEISKDCGVPAEKKEPAAVKPKEETSKVDADVKKKKAMYEAAAAAAAAAAAGKVPLPLPQHKQEAKKPEQKQTPTPTPTPPVRTGDVVKDAKAPVAATEKQSKAEVAAGEKAKAIEQSAKAAVDEEAEPEKKTSWCGGRWKELVPEDLVDMKWADGLVETARNNKELIVATIAAISLGFLLSHKLFSRN